MNAGGVPLLVLAVAASLGEGDKVGEDHAPEAYVVEGLDGAGLDVAIPRSSFGFSNRGSLRIPDSFPNPYALFQSPRRLVPAALLLSLRHRSSRTVYLADTVVDAEDSGSESSSGSGSDSGERDAHLTRPMDDAIQSMVAQHYAPDWLPFVPGASYWAPPQNHPFLLVEVVTGLEDFELSHPLSSD
ncbi:hypothetical protein C4D60_Mb01t11230 [Musa balbisiana]|uniref:Uncharacterized protein n=1 Tax=Musa balbisiana TaxID=52838 RepID=A0A4S8JNV3_MUSBA|nr:hypothetical protein C4D60_Mb01t11230 [Musa balbisiana]